MNKIDEKMRMLRRHDFESRAAREPHGATPLAAAGDVVTIHPLADELNILSKVGLGPEQCTSVDGYWSVRDDVVFLQIRTVSADPFREPGLYARRASYPPKHVNLLVVADAPYITRAVLENAALDLLQVGWDEAVLGDELVKLT